MITISYAERLLEIIRVTFNNNFGQLNSMLLSQIRLLKLKQLLIKKKTKRRMQAAGWLLLFISFVLLIILNDTCDLKGESYYVR